MVTFTVGCYWRFCLLNLSKANFNIGIKFDELWHKFAVTTNCKPLGSTVFCVQMESRKKAKLKIHNGNALFLAVSTHCITLHANIIKYYKYYIIKHVDFLANYSFFISRYFLVMTGVYINYIWNGQVLWSCLCFMSLRL